jgi:hypothetical protein
VIAVRLQALHRTAVKNAHNSNICCGGLFTWKKHNDDQREHVHIAEKEGSVPF